MPKLYALPATPHLPLTVRRSRFTITHHPSPVTDLMALNFYYGSGSPYAWRVWLALEHKAIPYELRIMSFSAGDLSKAEFVRINPRRKVPAITDGDFALYESAAILEYLDEQYASGRKLFPGNAQKRAVIRRLVREADEYFAHAQERLVDQLLFTPRDKWDLQEIAAAREALAGEFTRFESCLDADWLAGEVSAADFTLYPMIALCLRMEKKKPDLDVRAAIGPKLAAWMARVEALPFFGKTYPPHWKGG